ncbi:MAG: DnaJ domain-containing protein [Bacteroidales bacterium]
MLLADYYAALGLPSGSSIEEVKKAYRKKAREYHPDINHSPDATDQFIRVTEAYDFLIAHDGKKISDQEDYDLIMNEWRKYRQERSRQRAAYYARSSFSQFRNSKYYRSTRILNGSSIIFNFAISIMIFTYTILGFIIRIRHPLPDDKKPPFFSFIILLTLSIILFSVSVIYLKAYIETIKKHRRKNN